MEFNQCQNVKRGLLFEDGSEWYETRRRMNPIFLGPCGLTLDVVRDDAIADIRDGLESLEMIVHKWSVRNVLASGVVDQLYFYFFFHKRTSVELVPQK